MSSNRPHFCPDWDGMYIYPGLCIEMSACTCPPETMIKPGDILRTDYIWSERLKDRVVQECYQSAVHSQTEWWVKAEGLGQLDAGWFRER